MKAEECRQWRERIGALVLGQLPEEERFATEAHLDGCPACRAEAEALVPMASLLGRADPDRLAPAPPPPEGLGERILRRIAAERRAERRRRVRLRVALAAATAATVAAIAVVVVMMVGSDESTPAETVAFRSLPRGAFAEATLAPRPWGSEISVKVYGFPRGTRCQVWLRNSDGERVPAGSFRYVYEGEGEHLSSAVSADDAAAVGLQIGSKTFVAPLPPDRAAGGAS